MGYYFNPNASILKTMPSISLPAGEYTNSFDFLNSFLPIQVTEYLLFKEQTSVETFISALLNSYIKGM